MHQWTSLLSNCVNEQELLNGGEPLCKQRKAFYISLLCKQGLRFFIISNTISLASKHRQNRLARLVTADYTLNREGKIYVQKTKTSLESSPRLSRGKNTAIPSIERRFKACTVAREQLCVKYYIFWGCRCGFLAAEKRPRFLTVTWEMIARD